MVVAKKKRVMSGELAIRIEKGWIMRDSLVQQIDRGVSAFLMTWRPEEYFGRSRDRMR
jgi:hypothetical protein